MQKEKEQIGKERKEVSVSGFRFIQPAIMIIGCVKEDRSVCTEDVQRRNKRDRKSSDHVFAFLFSFLFFFSMVRCIKISAASEALRAIPVDLGQDMVCTLHWL